MGGLRPLGAVMTVALLAEEEDWIVALGDDDRCLRVTAASCDCRPPGAEGPGAGDPEGLKGVASGERDIENDCSSLVRLCTCTEPTVKDKTSHCKPKFVAIGWQYPQHVSAWLCDSLSGTASLAKV